MAGAIDGTSNVYNCSSSGTVTGDPTSLEAGGLVGVIETTGSISHSSSSANVSGGSFVGGWVGENGPQAGVITNSHATGNVIGTSTSGELIGLAWLGLVMQKS